jgi:hypothetical protein
MSPAYIIHDGSLRNGGVTRDKPNSKFEGPTTSNRRARLACLAQESRVRAADRRLQQELRE